MNIRITNGKAFNFLSDVNLNTIFNAKDNGHSVTISSDQLVKAGADEFILEDDYWYFNKDEVVVVETTGAEPQPNEAPCIRDMCCNQFGERDEMQRIINSLQADVIARGARIKTLEDALQQAVDERNDARFEVEELNARLNRLREYE